jgi:hypothetical protein
MWLYFSNIVKAVKPDLSPLLESICQDAIYMVEFTALIKLV